MALVVILGYTFTGVFLELPGGFGWAILFGLVVGALAVAVLAGIVRAILR